MQYGKIIGARQTVTAKDPITVDSLIDTTGLTPASIFYISFEPGRTQDVVLQSRSGESDEGSLLIPGSAGGDGPFVTPLLLGGHGPFELFTLGTDEICTLSIVEVFDQ